MSNGNGFLLYDHGIWPTKNTIVLDEKYLIALQRKRLIFTRVGKGNNYSIECIIKWKQEWDTWIHNWLIVFHSRSVLPHPWFYISIAFYDIAHKFEQAVPLCSRSYVPGFVLSSVSTLTELNIFGFTTHWTRNLFIYVKHYIEGLDSPVGLYVLVCVCVCRLGLIGVFVAESRREIPAKCPSSISSQWCWQYKWHVSACLDLFQMFVISLVTYNGNHQFVYSAKRCNVTLILFGFTHNDYQEKLIDKTIRRSTTFNKKKGTHDKPSIYIIPRAGKTSHKISRLLKQ